jgi:AcrR family transcriptional regulator
VVKQKVFARQRNSEPAMNSRRGSRQQAYLLGVVYDLISENGIDAVTMRQISEASGVSTGTINYHFKNKENLIISALEEAYQLPDDWEELRGSPAAKLRRLALFYALRTRGDRWWRFWINYLAASTRDEELQLHQRRRFERQLDFWTRLIEEGIDAGEMRADLEPRAAARDLLINVHGLLTLQFVKPDAEMRSLALERINSDLERMLIKKTRTGKSVKAAENPS